MNLFFTVCTVKNLAEAFVLGDSLKMQTPDYQLVIGLLDKKNRIPESLNLSHSVIEISEIGIPNFTEMCEKYTHDELLPNTKPFFADYLFRQNSEIENLVYFDCKSLIFNKLDFIFEKLKENNIIIVPQITQASVHPDEKQILNSGIFHAGFFALKRSAETLKFLDWLQKRNAEKGYIQLCKGMNADQLWLEHVPIFFEKVLVEKHEGLNVGAWNLAERKLQLLDNQWFSNKSPLISYNFKSSEYWKLYCQQLNKYQPKVLENIEPIYGLQIPKKKQNFLTKSLRKISSTIDLVLDKLS